MAALAYRMTREKAVQQGHVVYSLGQQKDHIDRLLTKRADNNRHTTRNPIHDIGFYKCYKTVSRKKDVICYQKMCCC